MPVIDAVLRMELGYCVCVYIRDCVPGVFIEVIHAGVIEGNHFTAKLYCNYGDERLLFRDTNTEWWWDCLCVWECMCVCVLTVSDNFVSEPCKTISDCQLTTGPCSIVLSHLVQFFLRHHLILRSSHLKWTLSLSLPHLFPRLSLSSSLFALVSHPHSVSVFLRALLLFCPPNKTAMSKVQPCSHQWHLDRFNVAYDAFLKS